MNATFGKTDLVTSPIVYGCMGGAGAFGAQEEKDSIEALREAFNVGINFFDTAEAYGAGYSEQLLSQALGRQALGTRHLLEGGSGKPCAR